MKQNETKETKSRFAKGIDYLSIRITIFVLATITFGQLGIHFYASIILAIISTVIINRQVNYYKQRKLTQMAKKMSKQEAATVSQDVKQEVATKAPKPLNFLMSALFLFGLGFVFSGWFKYYFYIFSFINVSLAIFNIVKLKRTAVKIKEESN